MSIVTLLSDPEKLQISQDKIRELHHYCTPSSYQILRPGVAWEIKGDLVPECNEAFGNAFHALNIDVVIQHEDRRPVRLLVADMDSTIIQQECIDELAAEAGVGDRVSAITSRAMNGEIEFAEALRERVAMLAGLPESILEHVWEKRIRFTPGASELVRTMRANGAHTVLISGGFTEFTRRVSESLGFDEHYANELLIENGQLQGAVREPILERDAKTSILEKILARTGIPASQVMAVGDGANDIPMLKMAGCGIAFRAKPSVAAQCSFRIEHCDLSALLYIQGIRDVDFKHAS